MSWFIKTEVFTSRALGLDPKEREKIISQHKQWINDLSSSGETIHSGFLVNEQKKPGGGGLLLIKSNSYKEAKAIIEKDPMILNKLVEWKLQEWIKIN